jgi:hypothetical protein
MGKRGMGRNYKITKFTIIKLRESGGEKLKADGKSLGFICSEKIPSQSIT